MKLTECQCVNDSHGQSVAFIASQRGITPQKLQEELWNRYGGYGYKFALVIDVSAEEYAEPESEVYVYYLDEIMPEVVDYSGIDNVLSYIGLNKVISWLEKKGVKVK